MLGNNADAFFTTPMRHRIVNGGNVGNQSPMPVPRDLNSSATGKVVTKLAGDFLPGTEGTDMLADEPAGVPSQNTILAAAFTPVGIGLMAGFLLLTPVGKALRKKIGLA